MDNNIECEIRIINVIMFLLDMTVNNKIIDLDIECSGRIRYNDISYSPTVENIELFNMRISNVEISFKNEWYFCIKYGNCEYDVITLLEQIFNNKELDDIYNLEVILLDGLKKLVFDEIMNNGSVTIDY